MDDEVVDAFIASDAFNKEIIDNIDNMYVLELNDNIIGLCVYKGNSIETLMVDCEHQSSGAAKFFLRKSV